jgi:hypothetical protein
MTRLRISSSHREFLTVERIHSGKLRLVYVICADRKINYKSGRSRIAYIGTTKDGIHRMAASAAWRSHVVFKKVRGCERFTVHVVTCTPRQHIESWRKLENALLLTFKDAFGEVPLCNVKGKRQNWGAEKELFRYTRLKTVIEDLS